MDVTDSGLPRHRALERILRLSKLIEHEPRISSLKPLARKLGVHERTVRRYLEVLERVDGFVVPQWRHTDSEAG